MIEVLKQMTLQAFATFYGIQRWEFSYLLWDELGHFSCVKYIQPFLLKTHSNRTLKTQNLSLNVTKVLQKHRRITIENKFEKDAFFSVTLWLVKSHHVTTSRRMRTGPYSCSQAHTVEVTCKQQKWRRGEEDATKNTCGIQTLINFQQQEDKTCIQSRKHIKHSIKCFFSYPNTSNFVPIVHQCSEILLKHCLGLFWFF